MNRYLHGIVFGTALAVASTGAFAQDRPRDDRRGQEQQRRGDDHHNDAQYHFRAEDRERFSPHYQKDIKQWHEHPDRRHRFAAGERIPSGVRLKSVPASYYRELPPPPAGYRFGYYDGYVVAYNPTTQIVADVLDLVSAAAGR